MRIKRCTWIGALSLGVMLTASASPGCVRRSIEPDLARVQSLTPAAMNDALADVSEPVSPLVDADAQAWLKEPIDVERAVKIAWINNRELRASLRELGIARGNLLQAGLLPNPKAELEFLPERDTTFEVRLEFDLTRAILAPMHAHAVKPELIAASYRAAELALRLAYDVRVAFFRVQAAEQSLVLANQSLDALAARRDAAGAMAQAGNVNDLVLAHEQAAYEQTRISAAQLALQVTLEREKVHRLLGVHGEFIQWQRTGDLPKVPEKVPVVDDLEKQAIGASLALRATKEHLEALARKVGVTRRQGMIPDLSVDAHGLIGVPPDKGPSNEPEWRLGAGVHLEIPAFDRQQGRVLALESRFDGLLERYYGQAIDLRSRAREVRQRLVFTHARARHYETSIVPAYDRVLQQTLLQYNAMQIGIFELLQARRLQLENRLAYVQALRDYWSANAHMQALITGANPEGVTSDDAVMVTQQEAPGGH